MNKDLLKYIKKTKKQGFSNEEIGKALIDVGWKREDIEEGFKVVGKVKPGEKSRKGLVIGIIIIVLLIIAGLMIAFNFESVKDLF